jgi:hypothetical protein
MLDLILITLGVILLAFRTQCASTLAHWSEFVIVVWALRLLLDGFHVVLY